MTPTYDLGPELKCLTGIDSQTEHSSKKGYSGMIEDSRGINLLGVRELYTSEQALLEHMARILRLDVSEILARKSSDEPEIFNVDDYLI